ncbi:uncharacterized protein N7483_002310 [Penicillium malachiteum]|uniref:uncharacterized protein n=1 Tax=Penicillium malachiteum TaxID=1324776 RepID=UPI0025470EE9|nr:uncharacterized protein N7483_002310 [Penicillium malachiteum]KAJ5737185.1 hypothetical protein N7483_002310 [Penicillium malachiteum]
MLDPSLKSTLLSKKWFGFDLDDTLHKFRKASSQASESVFEALHTDHGINIDTLRSTYANVLRTSTANAFTDGRSSTEYRRERFTRILQAHAAINVEKTNIDSLLGIYKSSLQSSLTLKPGVVELFRSLRQLGKNIIVVTEGPADAQEWTVRELGIDSYVGILVTTNEIGKSKVDGLFGVVLERYGIDAEEIVYFGDNEVRDVRAALQSGILAILYDEKRLEHSVEDSTLDVVRVSSWRDLQDILLLNDG